MRSQDSVKEYSVLGTLSDCFVFVNIPKLMRSQDSVKEYSVLGTVSDCFVFVIIPKLMNATLCRIFCW